MSNRILLVEGYTDTLLFRALLKKLGITDVEVIPPKDAGAKSNGIGNIVAVLPALLANLQANAYTNFAIVVDADYAGHNGGFSERKNSIENIISTAGYIEKPSPPGTFGTEYVSGAMTPIHLAILPDHSSNGMIEDLLLQCVPTGDMANLLQVAMQHVANLPTKLFNTTLHLQKAELATYLACSKSPGCDSGLAVKIGAIDAAASPLSSLNTWLQAVFP